MKTIVAALLITAACPAAWAQANKLEVLTPGAFKLAGRPTLVEQELPPQWKPASVAHAGVTLHFHRTTSPPAPAQQTLGLVDSGPVSVAAHMGNKLQACEFALANAVDRLAERAVALGAKDIVAVRSFMVEPGYQPATARYLCEENFARDTAPATGSTRPTSARILTVRLVGEAAKAD